MAFPLARRLPSALCLALLVSGSQIAQANTENVDREDWAMFGRVLALVQTVTSAAARSEDPRAAERGVEQILSGRNAEANRLASELLSDAFSDMPAEAKGSLLAVARDVATLARRDQARRAAAGESVPQAGGAAGAADATSTALQARKDLTAMGLRYFDAAQFLDAVRRDDALAVELFLNGRGVNPATRDADGRSAADIARAAGNVQISQLLARPR